MDEILRQAKTVQRGMWKHRWLGISVAWIVAAVAVVVVFRIPDKYEASARIFVDTQSILKPLMSGLAIEPNIDQQIMILSRTLISRPNVEKLVRMADLDLKIQSKAKQEELIDDLMKALNLPDVLIAGLQVGACDGCCRRAAAKKSHSCYFCSLWLALRPGGND